MRMDEARAAISVSVGQAITAAFHRDLATRQGRYSPPAPTVAVGDYRPGHDASRVPPVPETQLRIDRDSTTPGAIFTWKVESGHPPYVILMVPPHWLRDVVRPGHAVLDGHPVIQILDDGPGDRPVNVLALVTGGRYDPAMHGWRAYGVAKLMTVTWGPDDTPAVISA